MYFSGQGKVLVASRDASGNADVMRYLGDVSGLDISLNTTVKEHVEHSSGQHLVDDRLITQKKAACKITLDDWQQKNVALALFGADTTIAAGTVTAEALPAAVTLDDYVRLQYPKVSSVVVNDSAGTPATLVEGVDYEIESADHGTLHFIGDLAAYTAPFTVDYAYAGGVNINMFTQPQPELWIRFEGLNVANGSAPVLVELYKVQVDPASALKLISEDYDTFELNGDVLYDALKINDATLGQFGRIVQI